MRFLWKTETKTKNFVWTKIDCFVLKVLCCRLSVIKREKEKKDDYTVLMICSGKKHYQFYSTSKTFKEVKPRKQTEQRDMSWDARVPFSLSVSGWYF